MVGAAGFEPATLPREGSVTLEGLHNINHLRTPRFEVSQLLRHASIQMAERYAHLAPDHLQNAIANLGFSSQFHLTENPQQAVVYQNGVVT